MGILPAAEEAAIRTDLEFLLPDRCTVQRMTRVSDGEGGTTETPVAIATNVPCRVDVDQRLVREAELAGRQTAEAFYIVSLSMVASRWPGGVVDVKASDRLVVTGSGVGTYEPTGSGGPQTDEFLRAVHVTKVE